MTITDIERVVTLVQVAQPQIGLAVQAVIGLARWIQRRRENGEPEPSDDAVMAAWQMASASLSRASASLEDAQSSIDANLNRLR